MKHAYTLALWPPSLSKQADATGHAGVVCYPNHLGELPLSHIVTIKTEVRDAAAISAACTRLGLAQPEFGTRRLFSASAAGFAVQLPDWRYPVVFDTATARVHFDNYHGAWGSQCELDRFLQAYAVEKTKLEARRRGHTVTEQPLADGSIKLCVQLCGGAA